MHNFSILIIDFEHNNIAHCTGTNVNILELNNNDTTIILGVSLLIFLLPIFLVSC